MPIIKSAKKKLRKDRKRTVHNSIIESVLKKLIKAAKVSKKQEAVRKATQAIDKATKKHILHKNKASRIKSVLSKLVAVTPAKTTRIRKKASK